jgi:serine/threonine protein kinase
MTRADGGDVFEWRRYHRVPDYRVINNVVFQVAHGLAVLHKNGYIHRGIIITSSSA